jgi:radical SAM superfamily enzyme YgiQ (UPF0313 family)
VSILLVTPVTLETATQDYEAWLADLGDSIYEPSVGVLTLASILEGAGKAPLVFDLNGFVRDLYSNFHLEGHRDIFRAAAPAIAAMDADVFGFGTICSSYPLTVRIAEEVKRLRPDVKIAFGGPQASVVDAATLEAFEFVDCVVRGEADEIIVPAFEQLALGKEIDVPGVTYRTGERIVRNPNAPPVVDLDRVPAPAFHLSSSIDRCSYLPVEIGRGCPFSCTFCSTNDFFRRRFRLRSPARVLEEMNRLHALYGVTRFDLVHDMFTVDRSRVEAFCHAFLESGKSYTWTCSARSDFVDHPLLELMARAHCDGLFFGIETGSPRLQKIIDKKLDIGEAAAMIDCGTRNRITCTVSLIVGFPEETIEDVAATAAFALDSARLDFAKVQINLLAALAATPLFTQYRAQLFFDGVYSDMSHQTWEQNESDCAIIKKYPDLFPNFYGLPSGAGRQYVAEFRHFLTYGLNRCRWLMVALSDACPRITEVFDSWIEWRGTERCRARYYGTFQFAQDLCGFARRVLMPNLQSAAASMMVSYYEALYQIVSEGGERILEALENAPLSALPRRHQSLRTITLAFRPSLVIEALRQRVPVSRECFDETTVVFESKEQIGVEPRELPALGAAVLELCDGQTTIPEMVNALDLRCTGISPEQVISHGLLLLREQGLVCFEGAHPGISL